MCSRQEFKFASNVTIKTPAGRAGRAISAKVVWCIVAESLVLDELVTLEIPIESSEKQVIPARVVRAVGTEYGFQFMALSPEQRRQIRATLKGHPAIPYHLNQR